MSKFVEAQKREEHCPWSQCTHKVMAMSRKSVNESMEWHSRFKHQNRENVIQGED